MTAAARCVLAPYVALMIVTHGKHDAETLRCAWETLRESGLLQTLPLQLQRDGERYLAAHPA